ncbi:MAG: beta-ketoacyl-ACP synthase III, partial [Bacteroidota bacterium]
MTTAKPLRILGMGRYLPPVVSSAQLEERLGIPAGWTQRRSGVTHRHQVGTESNSALGARAAELALADCGLELGDVDLLLSASASFDCPLPSQACMIKAEMKESF